MAILDSITIGNLIVASVDNDPRLDPINLPNGSIAVDISGNIYSNVNNAWSVNLNSTSGFGAFLTADAINNSSLVVNTSTNINAGVVNGSFQRTYFCNSTSGNITVTLPTAINNQGYIFNIKKTSGLNQVIIDTVLSQTIDDSSSITILVKDVSISIQSDGNNWKIV